MMPRRALLLTTLITVGVVACDSDEFGLVGDGMPKEVTQDSLAVEIVVPLAEEFSVEPLVGESFLAHRAVVLGQRLRSVADTLSGWRATPLIRFDFANPIVDDIPLPRPRYWRTVKINLQMFKDDIEFGGSAVTERSRDVEVVELNAPLDSLMRDEDIETLLGELLLREDDKLHESFYDFILLSGSSSSPIDTLSGLFLEILSWMQAGTHDGIAIVDRSLDYDLELKDTLIRFAAAEMPRKDTGLLDQLDSGEIWVPSFVIVYVDPADETLLYSQTYTPLLDFTHVQREEPPAGELRLGTHPDARTFVRADLALAAIPSTATINEAELVFYLDNEFGLGRGAISVFAYEAEASQAASTLLEDLEAIPGASSTVDPMTYPKLTLDVTDFLQRYVNGLISADRGFLLSTTLNEDAIRSIDIFGSVAVDSLRPFLRVQFTPPPDFQE